MNDQKAYFNMSLKERIYLNSNRNKNYLGLNSLAPLATLVSPLSPPPPPPTPSQIPNSYENLKLSQTSSISSQPLVRYSLPVKSHVELDRFADRMVTENRTFFNLTEPSRIQEPSSFHDLKVSFIKILKIFEHLHHYLYTF